MSFPSDAPGLKVAEGPTAYDDVTIYDYMNGAADAYMRYAFRQLYVASYRHGDDRITAEVYDMSAGPEAFGVFTTDLTGEAVAAAQGARYAYGQLRGWQGRYFFRLEAPARLKDSVVALAQSLAPALGADGEQPALLARVPVEKLSATAIRFFHHKEDLNNARYISTANVLQLGPKANGLLADCRLQGRPLKLLLIQYEAAEPRDRAFVEYCRAILAEEPGPDARDCFGKLESGEASAARKLGGASVKDVRPEVGRASSPPLLAIILDANSDQTCRAALDTVERGPQ